MKQQIRSAIRVLEALTERSKELACLYAIEEALKEPDAEIDQVCSAIIQAIPPGWQFPEICAAKIILDGQEYCSPDFEETPWKLSTDIVQQDHKAGTIGVYYNQEMPTADVGPFLKEEKKLIETIANRLSYFLTHKTMKRVFEEWRTTGRDLPGRRRGDWEPVLDLIRQTDKALFLRITNKMLNHLCWSGVHEAEVLRRGGSHQARGNGNLFTVEPNQPYAGGFLDYTTDLAEKIFRTAADHLSDEEVLSRIQMWIQEDKLGALLQTVREHMPLSEVANALRRYVVTTHEKTDNRYPLARGLKVLLISRILSEQLHYINLARNYTDIVDLNQLFQRVIFSPMSQGKIGAKGAGFFLASQIAKRTKEIRALSSPFRVPKTWYICADMMLHFMHYNSIDEIVEQKYKEIERVRFEYPYVIEIFKQSPFPPEMINGLSMALDDLGDGPLIVRSSSLLEDRTESAFVDKYKSVFLGNRGTKEKRLNDLMRAVAEVYASNFGPDPIEYRANRGLLEFSEQLGIMIQEIAGTRVGPYFLPVYSGVARSRNHFRGSHEIKPEHGIVRLIPGLGSRIADRTSGERPVLVVPGRPSSSFNGIPAERLRCAPKKVDVINLESNSLETVELSDLLRDYGHLYPGLEQVVSVYEDGQLRPLEREKLVSQDENLVVTFEGLAIRSPFALQIRDLLRTFEEKLGVPVEIEFASDGEHIYIVQCRPQTVAHAFRPAPIPKDIVSDNIVLSARRYVPNGRAHNITHILYIEPAAYGTPKERSHWDALDHAMSKLNQLLPKRQFIVMAPGHRGVRGNGPSSPGLKYNHVSRAAVLVELAEGKSGDAVFFSSGFDFLQDLVESGICYLPVFPEDETERFNQRFLMTSQNILPELLPESAFLADTLHVIDVPNSANGKVLQVLMNAELNEAVGHLAEREGEEGPSAKGKLLEDGHPENYWRWRHRMVEQVASSMDPDRFGVVAFYLFGSTKNGTAGPGSDIDVLVHFRGTEQQREDLILWLEGWSLCLDEINYLQTGYRSGGLLDVHLVTDEDISNKTSYAVKINAVTDAAHPLKMGDRATKKPR